MALVQKYELDACPSPVALSHNGNENSDPRKLRTVLNSFRVRQLKAMLDQRSIKHDGCLEKQDLVEILILNGWRNESEHQNWQ
jgi:hypothetical protein